MDDSIAVHISLSLVLAAGYGLRAMGYGLWHRALGELESGYTYTPQTLSSGQYTSARGDLGGRSG